MRDGIIYDCPNANCRTPIYTGKCSKACIEKHNKELGIKPKTKADRIRAMSDEALAAQLAEVFCKGFNASTSVVIPDELVKEIMEQFLEQLKQPAEGE